MFLLFTPDYICLTFTFTSGCRCNLSFCVYLMKHFLICIIALADCGGGMK